MTDQTADAWPVARGNNARFDSLAAAAADRVVSIINVAALLLGVAVLGGLFVYYLYVSAQSGYFTPYSLLEEAAYTFTSAHNYLQFGYLNSGLLQDFSSSPFAVDHPYVYNHMPPGPDLVMSVLLWLTGDDYALVRGIFASSAIAGFVSFVLFGREMLNSLGVRFFGLLLVLISPWVTIQLFDRQVYSPDLLFTFLPLLLVAIALRKQKHDYFLAALLLIAIFSFYTDYSVLASIIFCWGMLYVTQLFPLSFRQIAAVGMAFAAGIGIHLLQNMLYFGWDNFWLELKLSLSNRITGVPTQQQLEGFYRGLGVVHHGSHAILPATLKAQIEANLNSPIMPRAMLALAGCVVWLFSAGALTIDADRMPRFSFRELGSVLWLFVRVTAWTVVSILAPIILFPAFAQEVNLRGSGMNAFFLAISFTFLAGYVLWIAVYAVHRVAMILIDPQSAPGRPAADITDIRIAVVNLGIVILRGGAVLAIAFAFAAGTLVTLQNIRGELGHIHALGLDPAKWSPLYDISRFEGGVFMTNINVPTVGFLTKAPGFGVCGPHSVDAGGTLRLEDCKTAYMRRYDYWAARRPRYFYYFDDPKLFPGFADCMPAGVVIGAERDGIGCMKQLRDALVSQYPVVMQSELVSVFDLSRRLDNSREN